MNRAIEALLPQEIKEALLDAAPEIALAPARHDALKDQLLTRVRGARSAHLTVRADEGEWEPMGPLVDRRILSDDGITRTFIMRLQPGARRPSHSHADQETSYVLQGSLRYGSLELKAGDYHEAAPGSAHESVETDTGAMVLIRAPVRPLPAPT
jgi:quercetin dioxygenase-like cupin family protein